MAKEKTLRDVTDELKFVREASQDTTSAVEKLIQVTSDFVDRMDKKFDQDRLNDEETRREGGRLKPKKRGGDGVLSGFRSGLAAGAGFSLLNLIRPARLVTLIFGGALAGLGVVGGLRGWEIGFVKSFFKRFFNILGLTDDGLLPKGEPRVSLLTRITKALGGLENRILRFFGVSTEGALLRNQLGQFTGGRASRVTIVSRITTAIGKLLAPLGHVAGAINKWIIGPGAKVLGFIGGATGLTKITSSVFRLATKILWPIAIIVSAFDAVKDWQNSDETSTTLKFIDAMGAFLGDFIGAPLDLLKKLVAHVLDWVGLKSAAEWLKEFSFEESIKNMISAVARLPLAAIDYVKGLMDDWDLVKTIGTMYDNAITKFVSAWTAISDYVISTKDAIESGVKDALDSAEIGFMRVSNFIKNIPDKLLKLVARILDFEIPKLSIPYDNRVFGKGEIVLFPGGRPFSSIGDAGARAEERISNRSNALDDSVRRLDSQTAARLAALEASGLDKGFIGPMPLVINAPISTSNIQSQQTNMMVFPSPFNDYSIPH